MLTDSKRASLDRLVRSNAMLWRGHDKNNDDHSSLKTGFEALDKFLPTGGWPLGAMTEILVDEWGNGELQILIPLLVKFSQNNDPIVLIAPPHIPYAPALQSAGVILEKLIIIDSTVSPSDLWWIAEKTLRHPDCGTVLIWPKLQNPQVIRRLQLAANTTNNAGFLIRITSSLETPVSLRLKLQRHDNDVRVSILKSRLSWKQDQSITLSLER